MSLLPHVSELRARLRILPLAVLTMLAGCSSTEIETASSSQALLPGPHRVQVSGITAAQLLQQGGLLVADYGSYALVDVDGAKLAALSKERFELRDEYRKVLLNAAPIDALDPSS